VSVVASVAVTHVEEINQAQLQHRRCSKTTCMSINILYIIISDESGEDPLLPHFDRCNHRTVRHLSSSVGIEDAVEEENENLLNNGDVVELPKPIFEEKLNTPEVPKSKKHVARVTRPSGTKSRAGHCAADVVAGRRIMPPRNTRRVDYVAL